MNTIGLVRNGGGSASTSQGARTGGTGGGNARRVNQGTNAGGGRLRFPAAVLRGLPAAARRAILRFQGTI